MEMPRSAKKEEFNQVIELINQVFRLSNGHKPTMQDEFPLLLRESNVENMIIISNGEKPVSTVNYMHEDILIQGVKVKAASIGAVCTYEDYRKKAYSSKILDRVEEKMFKENIDFALVSGERSLYTRRGFMQVKNFYKYIFKPKKTEMDFNLSEYEESYFPHMVDMYNSKATRYYRTLEEFNTLLNSATIPWGNFTYKKYALLGKEGSFHWEEGIKVLGYVIVRVITEKEKKYGEIVEAAGTSEVLSEAFKNIAYDLNLNEITYNVHLRDRESYIDGYSKVEFGNMGGTVKIINFKSFMDNLKPLFYQYTDREIVDNMEFYEDQEYCVFKYKDEIIKIKGKDATTNLVFAGPMEEKIDFSGAPNIEKLIRYNFPIVFPWPYNLNYQ
ncbi:GNAT family N-acetyltransferase [Hathewaya massiliensis]|uniref:GNAT family N-acetyltransferase n=1 Tax=Hathewaya massiliensis TaxID=1964382 RepID=UPI0011585F28|nr:GNAT family N-acetyltransferase [Hathewaya massiliensis]